jgi:RimJ/RimL family protein N-acetyltransferase
MSRGLSDSKRRPLLVTRVWQYYKQYGWSEFVRRVHHQTNFLVFFKEITQPAKPCDFDDVLFRLATLEDAGLLAQELGYWELDDESLVRRLLNAGDKAIIGYSKHQPTQFRYISWLSRRDKQFNALLGGCPDPTDICSRKIWVPVAFRGNGTAGKGLRYLEEVAFNDGVKRVWAFVIPDNQASRRLHERAKYALYGTLRIGRRFGRRSASLKLSNGCLWDSLDTA